MSDKTLALAGAFQSVTLVDGVAWSGDCDAQARTANLGSLFELYDADKASVADLYGGLPGLRIGLRALQVQLSGNAEPADLPVTRYLVGLMHLERKAAKRSAVLDGIRHDLDEVERQVAHFGLDHDTVTGALGDVYARHISPLGARILVDGDSTYLQDPRKAGLIRALLLSGIRALMAWRQVGGSRLHLLLGRKRILREAGESLRFPL